MKKARLKKKYRQARKLRMVLERALEAVSPGMGELVLNSSADIAPASAGVTLIKPADAARVLGVSIKTLANWRSSGTTGPRYVRVGSRIFYTQRDLATFVEQGSRLSTSDKGRSYA